MGERTPHDGRPYYCANCGSGYYEWLECPHLECGPLELLADAQERANAPAQDDVGSASLSGETK